MYSEHLVDLIGFGLIFFVCAIALWVERQTPEEKKAEQDEWDEARKKLIKRQDEDNNLDKED